MRWHRLVLSSVAGCTLLSGCQSGGSDLSAQALPAPGVARSQKGDPPAPKPRTNYLDALPGQQSDAVSGEIAARVCATVNGHPIFQEEVEANTYQQIAAARALPEPDRTKRLRELYKETLDALIDRELLILDATTRLKKASAQVMGKLQEAAEKEFDRRWVSNMKSHNGIKSDDELKAILAKQGLSLDMIRRQWTRQFIATEYLRNRVMAALDKIGHEHLQEYYESHPEEYKVEDSVEWLDLFVGGNNPKYGSRDRARIVAEQLAARVRNGEDFLVLGKQFDDGDSVIREGKGLGSKRGEIQPPECEEALFQMRPGDAGVIEIGSGFHVFKLVKRQVAGKKPFDAEVQKEIRAKLRNLMYDREVKKLVSDLKRKAVIEYARSFR